jgi:hypothetical protein
MAEDKIVEDLKKMNEEFRKLNGTFTSTVTINIPDIKRQITEDLKRELQGRSSYGTGV